MSERSERSERSESEREAARDREKENDERETERRAAVYRIDRERVVFNVTSITLLYCYNTIT